MFLKPYCLTLNHLKKRVVLHSLKKNLSSVKSVSCINGTSLNLCQMRPKFLWYKLKFVWRGKKVELHPKNTRLTVKHGGENTMPVENLWREYQVHVAHRRPQKNQSPKEDLHGNV